MSTKETIGRFTCGVFNDDFDLPHPPLDLSIILIVHQVVRYAFTMLRERGHDLATLLEDDITVNLCDIIENDLRQKGTVAGFNRSSFDKVTRQQEVANYDFQKISKAPDLVFVLRGDNEPAKVLSTHHALFVECKPIDKDHSPGKYYCGKGVQRFVDGDYAWAMQDALMLGYARQGKTISGDLIPAMKKPMWSSRLGVVELLCAVGHQNALHRSRHRRGFSWPGGKGPACEISVYHSWHRCD